MRRYLVVRLYLGWHSCVATGFALELLFAPRRLLAGTATVTVYSLAPPSTWGLLFLMLAVICAVGWRWPRHAWRLSILALAVAQICWALALLAPLFVDGHRTNLLASLPWIALGVTSGIVAVETNFEERRRPDVDG